RWRLECDGPVPSVPRRTWHRDLRRRGRGPWTRQAARRLDRGRQARRAARQSHLPADGCRRANSRGALDLGRPRLSGHRSGARLAQRHGTGEIPLGDRRRGARGIPAAIAARRHHPGARIRACARARRRPRTAEGEGSPDGGQPLGPRRQGPGQRRETSRGPVLKGLLDDRQKRTGWLLIIVSALYLVWFFKVRLLAEGLPIEKREW